MDPLVVVFLILLGILLISFVLVMVFSNLIRKSVLGRRYDDDKTLHYFSCDDFDNLKVELVNFNSGKLSLQGYIYSRKEDENYIGNIVFSHGLGAGQMQYMTEINHFVEKGYRVFSYDCRGCGLSKGNGIHFFSNALKDLEAAIKFIEKDERFKDGFVLYGHSMGGYCVNNAYDFSFLIKGVVSLSSFDKPQDVIGDALETHMGKNARAYVSSLALSEWLICGRYARSSVKSLSKVNYPVLLITGDKDKIVPMEKHYEKYIVKLANKQNIHFLKVIDRFHRPNITVDAAIYDQYIGERINYTKDAYKNNIPEDVKRELYDNIDYDKMVELDNDVVSRIDDFIFNCVKGDL